MKFLDNKYFLFFLRFILGLVFVFAGIEKIAAPNAFFTSIMNYQIFGAFLSNIISVVLPWIELITGILLIFGVFLKENLTIYMVLLIVFNLLVISAMIRGLNIDCGCFGEGGNIKVGFSKLAENFGLFFIALYLFLNVNDSSLNE